jgi:hypothetical protein
MSNEILEKIMKDRRNFKEDDKLNARKNSKEWFMDTIALICMVVLIVMIALGCYVLN